MSKPKHRQQIVVDPSVQFGQPCVSGRRITVEQVASMWWSGYGSLTEIALDYPGIDRAAVLAACWYVARYGSRTWRKRWADWLTPADAALWDSTFIDVEDIPLPPQQVPA